MLYTDGVTEARGEHGLFGEERLIEVLQASRQSSAAGLVDAVESAVAAHELRPSDDVALLAIQVAPRIT